jgi:hypothetical protein
MTKTRLLAELEPRVKYLEDAPPPSSDVIRANYLLVGGGSGAPGGDGYSGHMGYGGVPGQIKTAETILDTKLNYDIVVGAGGTGAPGGQSGLSSGKGGDSSFNAIVALGGPAQNAGGGGAGQNGLVNPLVGSTLGELSGGKYYLGGYGARGMEGTTQTGTTGPGLGGGGGLERLPGTPNMGGGGGGSHVGYGGYPGGGPGGSGVVQVQYKGAAKFSGGTITTIGEGADLKTVHTFNASGRLGTLNVAQIEILLVGGGGGGNGVNHTGGGGAGGVIDKTITLERGKYFDVTIGAGSFSTGSATSLGTLEVALGGGAGGAGGGGTGGAGGSGGGGGVMFGAGGAGTPGQGNNGASGSDYGASWGGPGAGGGAGGPASNGTPGPGINWKGLGPIYGKGGGVVVMNGNGAPNTGNGGTGAPGDYQSGGTGGSGIAIFRHLSTVTGIGGGTITVVGDYTYHTFTTSGSFST